MICSSCKNGDHTKCPSRQKDWRFDDSQKHGTGLSPENDSVQRSGMCPCRHRVTK